jgi:CRISPR/Cas system CSM-associated protein Csm3 (group 7 of RAMP superfamily)
MPVYLQIKVTAVFTSPFTVGTGALADSLADKPTIKDGLNRPFIPASSVKGRLRHTCEKLIRALQNDEHAACPAPNPQFTCPLDPARLGDYCPVCLIFGSPRRPSPLVFADLRQAESDVDIPTVVRTGVSIGRRRRVAEPQRLFRLETVAPLPQIEYMGEISGHLTGANSQALVALLVGGLTMMNTIGGSHARGLGRCRLEAITTVDGQPVDGDWLRKGLDIWQGSKSP